MLKGLWRSTIGKPCVGKRHARFDEGALETYRHNGGAPGPYSTSAMIHSLYPLLAGTCQPW